MGEREPQPSGCPREVGEFAERAAEYVHRAVGVALEYDSDTLPLLDHYLRSVPSEQPATVDLVATTAGAYFGEVVRRRLGGSWELIGDDPSGWRIELPGGLSFSPAAMVVAGIFREEPGEPLLRAPPKLREAVEEILDRMAAVSEEMYYSLCSRLDTLEHVQAVLLAVAASRAAAASGSPGSGDHG